MSFGNATPSNLVAIEKHREQSGTKFRLTYLLEIETLIVRTPTEKSEEADVNLGRPINQLVARIEI
jgi:hypothetical protein